MKVKRVVNILYALVTGSAVVIIRKGDQQAKVYCGRQCDKEFVINSMYLTLRKLIKTPRTAN